MSRKRINVFTRSAVVLLTAVAALAASCSQEPDGPADGSEKTNQGEVLVNFSLKVPAPTASRALTSSQEDLVRTIEILNFKDGKYSYTAYKDVPAGATSVEVGLVIGTYDIVVLANSRAILASAFGSGMINETKTKAEVLSILEMELTGKWNTAAHAGFPMSSDPETLKNMVISDGTSGITASLYRMMARVNVRLGEKNGVPASDNFTITGIYLYNRNTMGYLIGDHGVGGVYTKMANPLLSRERGPLHYDEIVNAEARIHNEIYVFEAANPDNAIPTDRPCLVVGGYYQGDLNYYRVDFHDGDVYLDILRNHTYNINVTAVNGPGYPTPELAFESSPINIEIDIVLWSDSGMDDIIYNGQHHAVFSRREIIFNQFAIPNSHTIEVRTNVTSDLRLSNFEDVASGDDDGQWEWNATAQEWSNGHFTVKQIDRVDIGNGDFVYTFEVITKPAEMGRMPDPNDDDDEGEEGDPDREMHFTISAANLTAKVTVFQSGYTDYYLTSMPDPNDYITIADNAQRIRIDIVSTHPYRVVLNNTSTPAMLTGVFNAEVGGTALPATTSGQTITINNIPASTRTLWLNASGHTLMTPRIASVNIEHVDTDSYARPITYNVVQVLARLEAFLREGGFFGFLPVNGGSLEVVVSSNLNDWYPVLEVDGIRIPEAQLGNYFSITSGAGNMSLRFTFDAIGMGEARTAKIWFENLAGSASTEHDPISIVQRAAPGGAADLLYWDAGSNTMRVGKVPTASQANMLFFKFGGVIGFTQSAAWGSAGANVRFNTRANNVTSWTHTAANGVSRYLNTEWNAGVRNVSENIYHHLNNVKAGKGDPCRLVGMTAAEIRAMTTNEQLYAREAELRAEGIGGWRLPTLGENVMFAGNITGLVSAGNIGTQTGYRTGNFPFWTGPNLGPLGENRRGGWFPILGPTNSGLGRNTDPDGFIPVSGRRRDTNAAPQNPNRGYYWSSTPFNSSTAHAFFIRDNNTGTVYPKFNFNYAFGFAIRCVRQ